MYLHLGKGTVVRKSTIVAVCDLDNTSWAKRTREFLTAAEKAGAVLGDLCHDAQAGGYSLETAEYVRSASGEELPPAFLGAAGPLAQQTVMCLSLGGPRLLPADEIDRVVDKFSRYGLKAR